MSDETPRAKFAFIPEGIQVTGDLWNEALTSIDALVDLFLLGQFVNTPPAGPADGDTYLIGGSPTGAWSGYAYKIACCLDGAWRFYTPFNGLRAYLAPTSAFIVYLDGQWVDWNSLISANEVSIASAATCDLGAAGALLLQITGTTAITSFGTSANKLRQVRFAGALTLTHNAASLILLGGASRTTAAGDIGFYTSDASGNWRERAYFRAASNPGDVATKTGTETFSNKTFSGTTAFPANTVVTAAGKIGAGTSGPRSFLDVADAILGYRFGTSYPVVTVATGAGAIQLLPVNTGNVMGLVFGSIPYHNFFDVIIFGDYVTPVVLSSITYGTPSTRNYSSNGAGKLALSLSGGTSGNYSIVVPIFGGSI